MGFSTKSLRHCYGLTQKQLAERYGIKVPTVSNWEQRECCPQYVYNLIYRDLIFSSLRGEI